MTMRVFFYVQHLLGLGHLKRASLLARAMAAAGLDVSVAIGGMPVAGIGFPDCARIVLPPVRAADASFSRLVTDTGEPLNAAFKDRRVHRLLFEFEAIRPDVLLIEQFPFGRRQFRFELMPLLEAARARRSPPLVFCSLRDVLVGKRDPQRTEEVLAVVRTFFDRILVHADPRLIALDASFPAVADIADKIIYTGYVAEPTPAEDECGDDGRGEVLVLAGGGAVGAPLLRAALAARPLTSVAGSVWRLITGPNLSQTEFDEIAWQPPPGVIVERWRDDLRARLKRARLAITQAGYNTIMDLLATRVPAVVVPFATASETEQTLRARVLAARGAFTLVETMEPSPNLLATAIEQALTTPPAFVDVDFRGAEATAEVVMSTAAKTPRGGSDHERLG